MTDVLIVPAILVNTYSELVDDVNAVKLGTKYIQIDVCDGQFTPQATWPYRKQDDTFDKMVREENGFPAWDKIDYEIDLMVNHPEHVVEQWVSAGAARIIIHAESTGDVDTAIEQIRGRVEVGLALNINTPLTEIDKFAPSVHFIQLMGIDHIGFQGQVFDTKVIERIIEVKKKFPDISVQIDGGVSIETALPLIEAGVDRLIVGSAIFNSDNPLHALEEFKNLI